MCGLGEEVSVWICGVIAGMAIDGWMAARGAAVVVE